jgi:glycosyltransferase domain-containing protein
MNGADLTILLPLKGRNLFTMRFLWHANEQKVPYRIVIADAEPHPSVQKAIDNNTFSNLNIVYKVYPPDNTLQDFYAKMASAAELVKTPYVMQVDNDDFLIPSGLELCMDWLNVNKDYVACNGLVKPMGFANTLDTVIGEGFNFAGKHYEVHDINYAEPLKRIVNGKIGETSYYYSVVRSDSFLHVSKTIAVISPTYLLFYEILFELSLLSLGKVKINDSFCTYIRQVRTSMSGHYKSLEHLLESDLGTDSRKIKNYLVERCGIQDDEKGQKEIDAFIRNWLVNIKLKSFLSSSETSRKIGLIKSFSPAFMVKIFKLTYRAIAKVTASKASDLDRIDSASPEYKVIFQKEIDEIRDTLRSKELREFLVNTFNSSQEIKQLQANSDR